jgi:GntR family transcriptional regulator
MKVLILNSSKQPIYEQISFQIKEQILTGVLMKDELLPSIRNLAKELHVSVITTKRAYEELERDGFIHTVLGKGTFVAQQNITMLKEKKPNMIEDDLIKVVNESKMLNISRRPEIQGIVKGHEI